MVAQVVSSYDSLRKIALGDMLPAATNVRMSWQTNSGASHLAILNVSDADCKMPAAPPFQLAPPYCKSALGPLYGADPMAHGAELRAWLDDLHSFRLTMELRVREPIVASWASFFVPSTAPDDVADLAWVAELAVRPRRAHASLQVFLALHVDTRCPGCALSRGALAKVALLGLLAALAVLALLITVRPWALSWARAALDALLMRRSGAARISWAGSQEAEADDATPRCQSLFTVLNALDVSGNALLLTAACIALAHQFERRAMLYAPEPSWASVTPGLGLLCCWLGLIRYFSISKRLSFMLKTLELAAGPALWLLVTIAPVWLGFAAGGTLLFGKVRRGL